LVTGITNLPASSGVRAEILEQRVVRVSLERPLDDGPVVFNYRISNGLAEAEGVITVIEIPAPSSLQPPVAGDDSITARVGQAIDIPVLANDEHPDGRDLTLDPRLDQALPDGAGLLFASGDVLRYLAPDRPGNFTAAYRVTGPDGQAATGLVRIAVREADPATNNPPVPQPVTARVLAGETVRIRIPVSGIDPDGDTVQLLGQSANPQKGAVLELDGDTLVYQAGEYSAGTDTFTYTVIDSLGARATGTVRVGISPRLDGARNPVAIVDEVTVRPGVTVSVQVLANDSDPDGSPLRVVEATPNDEQTTAEIVGDLVQVTPPSEPGTYGVIYAIENDAGGTSQNFIRVTVDPEASPSYPVAEDSVLALSDIIDRDTVTVDVLAGVFFADGDPRSLGLSIHPGFGGDARVTSDRQVEVTIGNRSQIIPFKVTHPDDAEVFSYAFIRVPGTDDALPQLDRRAPALRVNSEDRLVIELAERVVSVGGDVRLTDSSSVEATHGNGDDLVVDQDTLVFTSADKYFGPASISFEVADEDGRTAVLVLPITVLPRENQPPVFGGAVIDFEPGQEKVIDLVRLTTYPYPDDLDELAYEVLTEPAGFTSSLRGTELTLRANPGTPKGSVATLSVGVRDDLAEGDPGRITLTVVPSTLPLVRPGADTAVAQRGGTTSVDVLANDEAGNPFPGEPLTVVDIRGLDGGALPAGVEIRPSADRSRLTVTVAPTAVPGDVGLQYQVADATGDAERMVWGSILVSVQDRPDPVQNLGPSGFADQRITMRWNAGLFNNSPITGYKVTTSKAGAVLAVTACPGTTCEIPTPGNGPANGVTVSVVATNAIGDSDPVTMAEPVWSDIIPPAPGGLSAEPLDRGLRLRWNEVSTPDGGSPVDRYRISVGGLTADVGPSACSGGVCFWDTTEAGLLDNGVEVSFTVSARNAALTALSVWNTSEPASGVPAGPPIAGAAPFATTLSDTVVALDWGGVFNPNGRPISAYTAAAFTGGAPRCNPDGGIDANGARLIGTGGGTGAQFTGLSANVTYSLVVFAYNGQGCTASATVTARTPPGVVTAIAPGGPVQNGDVYDFSLTGGSFADGSPLGGGYSVYYRLVGGSVPGTEHGPVPVGSLLSGDGLQYGQAVGVQVRACLDYDGGRMCQSEYSSVFPLGVPVDPRANGVRFERSGSVPLDAAGTFSWLAFPAGAYDSVEFACGTDPNGGAWQPAGDTLTCQVPPALAQTPYLHIRVTVGGRSYVKTYNGFQI
ncbi:MAG TPA: Ig-like domain-containing protein, partial [Rhodoglobus sp.]|nr:Ig-like domain-containing protein [Rhodoglobus sp.]